MNPEKALTLKSAKKVPILIPFEVIQRDENGVELRRMYQNCIFKMGDDCRQDQLALQIIAIFKRIFDDANLPLYLYPYKVITTARECGIIECVPDTMSRHQVGALLEGDLFEYFVKKYGHVDSVSFQKARRNFIESMAAYSVVSYILAIKDRHNGNILLDSEGHVIHIDFGFLFDIQPGGRFGLEQFVDFKLTKEMLMIMGEGIQTKTTVHSDAFNLFVDLVIKGYLAARDHMDSILKVVEVMLQSTLPCFTPNTMRNLKARFCADKTDKEAARFMKVKINSFYENIFSYWYDKYQELFEEIRM
jgi:phosphatidylinositol 4-kinase